MSNRAQQSIDDGSITAIWAVVDNGGGSSDKRAAEAALLVAPFDARDWIIFCPYPTFLHIRLPAPH
jgi:hypothetical protein